MSLLTDVVSIATGLIQSVVQYKEKSLLLKIEEQTKRVFVWCGLLAVITLILLAGIGFVIAGVYILLAAATGAGIAALIVGVIISLLMAILMLVIKSSMR
jgi:hypothetical protein